MRMSIVRSFLWHVRDQSNAREDIPSYTAAKDQGDQRVDGRPYQLHKHGGRRVSPSTRDRFQLGFLIGTLNADDFLF